MSSLSPTREIEDDSEAEQVFSISLTDYSKVKKTLWGKATSKEEKSTKTKKLVFVIKPSNYINFLQGMLQKLGQEDYEVTARKHYPFKYLLPKTKWYFFLLFHYSTWTNDNCRQQAAVDMIDIDNVTDYRKMVTKITESKPSTVKILIDMWHIQKLSHI